MVFVVGNFFRGRALGAWPPQKPPFRRNRRWAGRWLFSDGSSPAGTCCATRRLARAAACTRPPGPPRQWREIAGHNFFRKLVRVLSGPFLSWPIRGTDFRPSMKITNPSKILRSKFRPVVSPDHDPVANSVALVFPVVSPFYVVFFV